MDSRTRDIVTNPEVIAADEHDFRDVWAHTTAVTTGALSASVLLHRATMFVVSPR